ncbi:MAG: DUF3108 domain-containing protein [Candidatus Omnitrophica bacterium]|nr:DUF3108 domain-containing protein [Candidatus Omnitrophota bacterium]
MRRPLFLLLVLVLVVVFGLDMMEKVAGKKLSPARPAEVAAVVPIKKPQFPDRLGEKIIYDVMLGSIKLGTAVFHYQAKSELNQKPVNFITFETKAIRFKDSEKIYSDPGTSLPLKVEREISNWPKYEKIIEVYDQEKFSLHIVKTESGHDQELDFKKDAPIHNSILLPYYVRQIPDLAVGWKFQANLPTQQFSIELASIEEIKIAAGTFKAYHFKSTPERFEIWVSADEHKIPLKIKGMSGIGYTLVMREYVPGVQS